MADIYDNKMDGGPGEESMEIKEAMNELELLKNKTEKADDLKARLILEKLEEDEAKDKAKKDMMACIQKQEDCKTEFTQSLSAVQDKIQKLGNRKNALVDKLRKYEAELKTKRADSRKLQQKFKICVQIPDTEVKFSVQVKEEREDKNQAICGVFAISQRHTVLLQGGQALITFEEEKVATQLLKIPKCSVSCDDCSLDVKPKSITMDPAVKFEVHLEVSRKQLMVSNVPSSMSEERTKDRLEMSFSRPSRGGGEVERVDYNKNTGAGQITFLNPGVAESLSLRGMYFVDLDASAELNVGPSYKYKLRKFQTFCGSPRRTILLDDIKDVEDEEDLQDHLEIHFQKPKNYGGEIESIKYISKGRVLQAFFSL